MIQAHDITTREVWHNELVKLPYAHILQSWEWGAFKQQTTGWNPRRIAYRDESGRVLALASLLTRRIGPFAVMYIPKGPVLDYADESTREAVFDHLQGLARGVIWLKIDPDVPVGYGIPGDETRPAKDDPIGVSLRESLLRRGWTFSGSQVQFRNTLTLNLTQSEDELLADMSQGTRRNIRKAEKAGVVVREADLRGADLQTLYDLYAGTGERQGFLTRPMEYYHAAWRTFIEAGLGYALIAEVDGEPVGGGVFFHLGQKVWYFYGMSSQEKRDAQPNYALQWRAIRHAKTLGYPVYDWWGAPDVFHESDSMWGVYRFKDGFGGTVVRHVGAWDYAPNRLLYRFYEIVLPRLMHGLRSLRE